jgi:hypothetical protein
VYGSSSAYTCLPQQEMDVNKYYTRRSCHTHTHTHTHTLSYMTVISWELNIFMFYKKNYIYRFFKVFL